MRNIQFIILILALAMAQTTFAQHKHKRHRGGIDSTNLLIHLTDCSVSSDGTIKNKIGEVVGKLTPSGTIIAPSGQIIGNREETTEEKIGKIYISN